MAAELHPRLQAALAHPGDNEFIVVIIELPEGTPEPESGTRAERIAQMESAFQAIAGPVKAAVETLGGEVIDEAWINSTLKCRVPATALKALAERGDITKIDLPRSLSR
jgi:hypothetical protein